MPFLFEEFPDPADARLHSRHRQFTRGLELEQLEQRLIGKLRVVDQLNGSEPHARTGVHLYDHVELVSLRMRYLVRSNLGLVKSLFLQRFFEPFEGVRDIPRPVRLPQRQLHRRHRRCFRRGRFQPLDDDLIDEQIFPREEIQPDPVWQWKRLCPQIREIPRLIKRSNAGRHRFLTERLSRLHPETRRVFLEHFAVFSHDSNAPHNRGS